MTQGICFNHLTKRFDDTSAKWEKSWEFLPESFLLSEEVLEQLKLVDAMEEVSGFFLRNMYLWDFLISFAIFVNEYDTYESRYFWTS